MKKDEEELAENVSDLVPSAATVANPHSSLTIEM
jgi:hypothetical protein